MDYQAHLPCTTRLYEIYTVETKNREANISQITIMHLLIFISIWWKHAFCIIIAKVDGVEDEFFDDTLGTNQIGYHITLTV